MNRMNLSMKRLLGTALLLLLIFPARLFAAEAAGQDALVQQFEKLQALKTSNPEAYQAWVEQKKKAVQSRYEKLRSQDPRYAESFQQKQKEFRKERLKNLRQNHPEKFRQFMERRAGRLERMQEQNPRRFEQLTQKHPQWNQKIRRWKEQQDTPDAMRANAEGRRPQEMKDRPQFNRSRAALENKNQEMFLRDKNQKPEGFRGAQTGQPPQGFPSRSGFQNASEDNLPGRRPGIYDARKDQNFRPQGISSPVMAGQGRPAVPDQKAGFFSGQRPGQDRFQTSSSKSEFQRPAPDRGVSEKAFPGNQRKAERRDRRS